MRRGAFETPGEALAAPPHALPDPGRDPAPQGETDEQAGVLIVGDHKLFADAVAAALGRRGYRVASVGLSEDPVREALTTHQPDLVLLDLTLSDGHGLRLGQLVLQQAPGTRVVALTDRYDAGVAAAAIGAGFRGYVKKDTEIANLALVIRTILDGGTVVVDRAPAPVPRPRHEDRDAELLVRHLTSREREILGLLVEGARGREIASRLSISGNTLRTHVQRILHKLQVHSRIEAAAFAVRHRVFESPIGNAGPLAGMSPNGPGRSFAQPEHPSSSPLPRRWSGRAGPAVRERITVLLAHRNSLLRQAVKSALADDSEFHVVAEAGDASQIVAQAGQIRPDVLVVDAELPGFDALETVRLIRVECPDCRVIVISDDDDVSALSAALRAGASGFFTNESGLTELLTALRAVHRGGVVVPPPMLASLLDHLLQRRRGGDGASSRLASLSRQEQAVLRLLADGASRKEIARALGISTETARTHLQNVRRKLGVHSRLEAAAFARQRSIRAELWDPQPRPSGPRRRPIS